MSREEKKLETASLGQVGIFGVFQCQVGTIFLCANHFMYPCATNKCLKSFVCLFDSNEASQEAFSLPPVLVVPVGILVIVGPLELVSNR